MLLHTQYKSNSYYDDISDFHYDSFWTVFDDNKTQTFHEYMDILLNETGESDDINLALSDLILKNEHIYKEDEMEIIIKKYSISHLSTLEKEIENTLKSLDEPSVFEGIFKNVIKRNININKKFDKYRNKNITDKEKEVVKNENINKKIIYTKYFSATAEKISIDYFYTILDIEKKNNLYIKDVFMGSSFDYDRLIQIGENILDMNNVIKIYSKLYGIDSLDKVKKMCNHDIYNTQTSIGCFTFPGLSICLNESKRYDKIRNVEI